MSAMATRAPAGLSPRLAAVAARVLPGWPMADIGTDHGYLPVHLVRSGICPTAVATDCRRGPLAAAAGAIAATGLTERIQLRLGDGLTVLAPGEVATAVLAGMGGALMVNLLTAAPAVWAALQCMVLQPTSGVEGLRRWLAEHAWHITGEDLTLASGRVYVTVAAAPGAGEPLSLADLVLGPHLRHRSDAAFQSYVHGLLFSARHALAGSERARRPDPERQAALSARVALLTAALERCGAEVAAHRGGEQNHTTDLGTSRP